MGKRSRVVYSTRDPDAHFERQKGSNSRRGTPKRAQPGVKGDTVYVERSKKGRGGKTVTLVINLPGDDAAKRALLKQLKAACGAGGTLKDGVVEIQGDHRDRLVADLGARGLRVKPRGG